MNNDTVPVEVTYKKSGHITVVKINGVIVDLPPDMPPHVQFLRPDTEWVTQKFWMTPEEIQAVYGRALPVLPQEPLKK